jgi:hypothetical protein
MAEQTAEGEKAEQSSDNPILKYLGSAVFAAFVAFLTWFTAESTELKAALTTLAAVLAGSCGLVTSLRYNRYLGVLGSGGAPARSPERLAYIRLRNSLAEGGQPTLIYAAWLAKFLDGVDRFFGDADKADQTLFPRAFGLKNPVPLWTAPAFDRCLLLALIYPIAVIYGVWAISGHAGPAQAMLQLTPNVPGWGRAILLTMGVGLVFAFETMKRQFGILAFVGFSAVAVAVVAAFPDAEYWWLYATLFSTMIPSIINLMIGGASLMRGVPGVPSLLLRFMPANRAVPVFDRAWIATVLTLQLVGGAIIGAAVQFALLYAVFGYVMPWLGLELLDMARAVAAYDLPGKLLAAW